jgi:hypothetical protein
METDCSPLKLAIATKKHPKKITFADQKSQKSELPEKNKVPVQWEKELNIRITIHDKR